MKKLISLLVILALFSLHAAAQTKLIAHKSHSGTNDNFRKALFNSANELHRSNFGAGIEPIVKNAQLDTLQFISKSIAIMTTSNYCRNGWTSKTKLWQEGKETMINHPLFSHQHSLDSIKFILETQYNFQNSIDDVVFIGYDNGEDLDEDCGTIVTEVCEDETIDENEELEAILTHIASTIINTEESKITIIPNPTSDYFNLSESVSQVLIFDLNGKLCLRKSNEVKRVNISHLTRATYLVVMKDNKGIRHSAKVVKI